NVTMIGGQIFMDQKNQTFLATRKPVMIFYKDNDSTFVAADTLFSGIKFRDTLLTVKDKRDSLNMHELSDSIRFFQGFRNVRIYNDSLQAVCDSLYYSAEDSAFRLFKNPLVWNGKSQISGDTMYMYTRNSQPDLLKIFNNSFIINHPEKGIYNQISGRTLDGYFIDGNIDYVDIRGSARSIFYPQNEDSAYIGMNKTSGDKLQAFFKDKQMERVKMIR